MSPPVFGMQPTRGAIILLEGFLRQAQWPKTVEAMCKAWAILSSLDEEFGGEFPPAPPVIPQDTPETSNEVRLASQKARHMHKLQCEDWLSERVKIQLTDRERDAARECILFFTEKGMIEPSMHYNILVEQLGLVKE